jgi:hypothetical protein
MGLDMYLKYRRSFHGYEHTSQPEEKQKYHDLVETAGIEGMVTNDSPFIEIEATVIYWRKANAIHGWFVNELGGGEDNCQNIYVSREKLVELRNLCFDALSVPAGMTLQEHAPTVLPPTSGFFFGSYEIDDWYVKDLERTMEEIDRILPMLPADGEGWDWGLTYQASW